MRLTLFSVLLALFSCCPSPLPVVSVGRCYKIDVEDSCFYPNAWVCDIVKENEHYLELVQVPDSLAIDRELVASWVSTHYDDLSILLCSEQ